MGIQEKVGQKNRISVEEQQDMREKVQDGKAGEQEGVLKQKDTLPLDKMVELPGQGTSEEGLQRMER